MAESTTKENTTLERDEIDPVFKEVITDNFGQLRLDINTQVEVSRLPRTMDALVVLKSQEEKKKAQQETAFDYLQVHNQIEYKGRGDRLTLDGYHTIRGRSHLYLGEKKLSSAEMTVTIISAGKPINVLRHSADDVRWEAVGAGHYKSTDLLPIHLFVCNELDIEPMNYPLLLFASSERKFREFAQRIVAEDNETMIYYALRIRPEITEEVLKMAGRLTRYEKHLLHIAETIGDDLIPILVKQMTPQELVRVLTPDERVNGLTPDERVSGLTPEERASVLTPDERIRGLTSEDIVRSLSPEMKQKVKQLLNGDEDK